jgi:mannose-6-phosphate isomerase
MQQISLEDKSLQFDRIRQTLTEQGLVIVKEDQTRPWGGFFVLDESQAADFIRLYFDSYSISDLQMGTDGKLSPKVLLVAPGQRLSWQYHHRRAEIWKVVNGIVGVVISESDTETPLREYQPGDLIQLATGTRHRLVGLSDWGVIAEIWQHTDAEQPSDEDDIIRLQDDFGR